MYPKLRAFNKKYHRIHGGDRGSMRIEEYEIVIGKLVLAKEFLTLNHYKMIDEVIETLAAEYTDRRTSGELDN